MTVDAFRAAKRTPSDWTKIDPGIEAGSWLPVPNFEGSTYLPVVEAVLCAHDGFRLVGIGALHSIGLPVHVYPLYENGFRAHRGQPIKENNAESARLYADFAKISKSNEFSWNYNQQAPTEEEIGTVTSRNRMICFPCTPTCFVFIVKPMR